jgi:hypothetical protein
VNHAPTTATCFLGGKYRRPAFRLIRKHQLRPPLGTSVTVEFTLEWQGTSTFWGHIWGHIQRFKKLSPVFSLAWTLIMGAASAPKEKALAISPVPFLFGFPFGFLFASCVQCREPIFVAPHKRQ